MKVSRILDFNGQIISAQSERAKCELTERQMSATCRMVNLLQRLGTLVDLLLQLKDAPMTQSRALSNTRLIRAALVVLLGFLASGVLGFVRQGVLAAQFGAGTTLDAFFTAQRIPEFIFVLVAGGALGSSFIPIYAQQREQDEAQAWRLASAVMTLSAVAAVLLSLTIALFAPFLVEQVLLRGASADEQQLTASMMRLMMLTPAIFAVSGLIMGILQTHGSFLLPSLAVSMNSLGIIVGALFIAPNLPGAGGIESVAGNNIYGVAIGAVLSAVFHLAVQLPALPRVQARLRPLLDWRLEGVREVLTLMLPRVWGQGVVQINFVVNIVLTSTMIDGSLSALNTAFVLMFTALGLIGQSVGSAVFPTLATHYAEGDMDAFKDRLSRAMRSVLFLALPATVAFIVLGEPIVSIFERGEWTSLDTQATAWALSFYAVGIAGFALLEVLSRAFYALADTWTPVLATTGAILSNIVLSIILVQVIGDPDNLGRGPFAGLALANAATTLVEALILWWLMRRRIGGLNDAFILNGTAKTAIAAVVMGIALVLVNNLTVANGFGVAVIGGVVGGAIFFGVSFLLGLDEARAVPMMLLRRVRK